MAEVITYADLRFVKAPLRKNITHPGHESDEDGEITYENVQVPSAPEAPTGLTPLPEPESQAELHMEQPATTWSSAISSDAEQMLPCHGHPCCSQYLLLGLLLTCLLLGVAAICLGVRYQQTSQQFGQLGRLLEATNSSLQEQLHLRTVQLGRMEKDLQNAKEELAQSQRALGAEQRAHQATQVQLEIHQEEKEKTQKSLQMEVAQRQAVQQKLNHLQDTLKPIFTCSSLGICCVVGWILTQGRCFHISLTERNWQESQEYCKSQSSDLASVSEPPWRYLKSSSWKSLLSELSWATSYWVGNRINQDQKYQSQCSMIDYSYYSSSWSLKQKKCNTPLPCICVMAFFRFSDGEHSLQNPGVRA